MGTPELSEYIKHLTLSVGAEFFISFTLILQIAPVIPAVNDCALFFPVGEPVIPPAFTVMSFVWSGVQVAGIPGEGLGLADGERLAELLEDGDKDADGESEDEEEALGESEADGDRLALAEADGERLAEGDREALELLLGLKEALGDKEAELLALGDKEALGD